MSQDQKFYWTYERDEEIYDAEFDSANQALLSANETFAEECEDNGIEHNETRDEEIYLIYFKYDDDGERVIDERMKQTISHTGYHGDMKEHGVWHSGAGGVL